MKKIRLGNESGRIFIIFVSLFLFAIIGFDTIAHSLDSKAILRIVSCIVSWTICFFVIHCFEAHWYIKFDENTLQVKNILGMVREYKKSEISICYAVKSSRYKSITTLRPCLMIGILLPRDFCFENMFKYVYENYFLVSIDNKKKLSNLLQWINDEIRIPIKEEFDSCCKSLCETNSISIDKDKQVKEYYVLIEEHNKEKRTNK